MYYVDYIPGLRKRWTWNKSVALKDRKNFYSQEQPNYETGWDKQETCKIYMKKTLKTLVRNIKESKKRESYPMFIDRKTQYCQDVNSSQFDP